MIPKNYSEDTFRTDKVKNKLALQKELGLEVDKKRCSSASYPGSQIRKALT